MILHGATRSHLATRATVITAGAQGSRPGWCALLSTAATPPHTFPAEMRGAAETASAARTAPTAAPATPRGFPSTNLHAAACAVLCGGQQGSTTSRPLTRALRGERAFAMPHAHTHPLFLRAPGSRVSPPCAPWCAPQLTVGCVAHTNPRPTAATAPSGGCVCPSAANRRRQPHAARHLHASPASSPASMPASPPTVQAPRSNAAAFFLHQRPPPHSLASPCQLCLAADRTARATWPACPAKHAPRHASVPITEPRPVASQDLSSRTARLERSSSGC